MTQMQQSTLSQKTLKPAVVYTASVLFFAMAIFWVAAAGITLIQAGGFSRQFTWVLIVFMLGNALILLTLGVGLWQQKKWFFRLSLVYLALNIILTITDQFGLTDLIYLLFTAVLLVFLVLTGSKYQQQGIW